MIDNNKPNGQAKKMSRKPTKERMLYSLDVATPEDFDKMIKNGTFSHFNQKELNSLFSEAEVYLKEIFEIDNLNHYNILKDLAKLEVKMARETLISYIEDLHWDLFLRNDVFKSKKEWFDFMQGCIKIGVWERFNPESFMERFWKLVDDARIDSKYDTKKQRELIKNILRNKWTFDEIWLFRKIIEILSSNLESMEYYRKVYSQSQISRYYLGMGTIALGSNAYEDGVFKPKQFCQNVLNGAYKNTPGTVESNTSYLRMLPIDVYEETYFRGYDFTQIENHLDGENEYTELIMNFDELVEELKVYLTS